MVFITGDIHGRTEPLHDLMTRFQPNVDDIVVLLGDVGINYTGEVRDRLMKQELSRMKPTFFCIHGNHENRPQNIGSYQVKAWHDGRVLYEPDFPKILFPIDGDIFDIEGKRCIVVELLGDRAAKSLDGLDGVIVGFERRGEMAVFGVVIVAHAVADGLDGTRGHEESRRESDGERQQQEHAQVLAQVVPEFPRKALCQRGCHELPGQLPSGENVLVQLVGDQLAVA